VPAFAFPRTAACRTAVAIANEVLANRTFANLDELEEVQSARCRILQANPALIRAYTLYHWWPGAAS
jgi:hypothetical protein